MKQFRVRAQDFFAPYLAAHAAEFARTQGPMSALCRRYELRGKRLLSLGPGVGSEEYWLWREGACALTFVDIDEHGSIEPMLEELPPAGDEVPDAEALVYYLGDAAELAKFAEPFEAIYISGFTPDEMRRRRIQLETVGTGLRGICHRMLLRRSWPEQAGPLSDFTLGLVAESLAPAGIFVLQEYYAPIDSLWNGHMIAQCQQQLRGQGIELLEHHHIRSRPWIRLWVARRGGVADGREFLAGCKARAALPSFLGRLMDGAAAATSFSLLDGDAPDLARLRAAWWRRAPRRFLEVGGTATRLLGQRLGLARQA